MSDRKRDIDNKQIKQKSQASMNEPEYKNLLADKATDVCIVGCGITGLLNAYALLKRGYRVLIIDASSAQKINNNISTGHLSDIIDEGFARLIQTHGLEKAKIIYEAHKWAIQEIESLIANENIDCNFEYLPGILLKSSQTSMNYIFEEIAAAEKVGVTDYSFNSEGTNDIDLPHLVFENQARVNVNLLTWGLLKTIQTLGAQIYFNTPYVGYEDGPIPQVICRGGFKIYCKHIIFCTNKPLDNKITPTNNQVVFRTFVQKMKIPKNSFPNAMLWDTSLPYHYAHREISQKPDWDYLLIGGEDVPEDQPMDPNEKYSLVRDWALMELGLAGDIVESWTAKITETSDGLGYIGRPLGKKNVYIVNGDSGHGITQAAISTIILSHLIARTDHAWIHTFAPYRHKIKSYTQKADSSVRALQTFKKRWNERKMEHGQQ